LTDVFISYARADRNRVRLIAAALAAEGFSVWWDPNIKPGAQWNAAIRQALEEAGCVVTCWSKTSVKSQWVAAETTRGNARGVLIPVMIETCEPPIPFNMTQSADLVAWRGDGADPNWTAALERIRALVEAKRRLAAAAPPPGEAYGAERAATAAEETFQYTPGPRRWGPRLGQLLVGGAVATLVLTGGLWLAPRVSERFSHRPQPPVVETPVAQAPNMSAPETPAVPEVSAPPVPEPSAPAVGDTPVTTPPPAQQPPVTTPTRPAGTAAPTPQVADATRELDGCVSRLVAQCPNANGQATGFAVDGRLGGPEQRFLDTLQIVSTSPVRPEAVAACQGVLAQRATATRSRRPTLFEQACGGVTFPASAPATAPATNPAPATQQPTTQTPRTVDPRVGQVIERIPQILNRGNQTQTQTQQPAGQTTQQQQPTAAQTTPNPLLQTTVRVRQTYMVDLDRGSETRDGADLWFQAQTNVDRVLTAQNGAQVVPLGQDNPTYATCSAARYSDGRVPLTESSAGQAFCVRTGNGNIAGVRIVAGPGQSPGVLSLTYTLWPLSR
jgi:hypothetical protein